MITTSANGPEMPERTRMKAPTALQTTGENGASHTEHEIEIRGAEAAQADCSPDSQTGERTQNCGAKKWMTHTQVRGGGVKEKKPATSPATNLETGPGFEGNKKFVQRGTQGICGREKKLDRSA